MRLKSFEIQGFKTFPDKISLSVENGLTAVVGPNGSGKSNIAEALRWVLGEQNPHVLRCEKRMEEIIFHGTERRGPVGFAEVTVRLDNSDGKFPFDGDEVGLTRRLYRSGESEYFINRQNVRLKDINLLLADTGLGRDGYSIIGQGMLTKIIADRPGERRRVFEEASGIAKYRSRKEESERKLASAQENLVRIGDKIDELTPQVTALKAQAETAKQYLILRDELREHEINVWMDSLEKVRRSFGALRDGYREAKERSEKAQAELQELYSESDRMDEENARLHIEAEEARGELSLAEDVRKTLEGRLAVLQSELAHLRENMERILAETRQSETKAGSLDEQAAAVEGQKLSIANDLETQEQTMQDLLARAGELSARSERTAEKLDALRLREDEENAGAAGIRLELASLGAQLDGLAAARQTASAELDARKRAIAESEGAIGTAAARLGEAKALCEELENVIEGYGLRQNSRKNKVELLRQKLSKAELELNTVRTRHSVLSEQEHEYQGFYGSVKLIMKERMRNVCGTVSELIHVDDGYTVAIETALGSALQNIVVRAEEDAKACISLLKSRQAGRATFLPMSSVDGRLMDAPDGEPGFVGVAARLVETDRQYEGIIRSLLGRTAVVETLDQGIAMARKHKYSFRIVTLDGQVLNAGGSIAGGSVNKATGLLSRKNELERLEERLQTLTEQAASIKKETEAAERELSAVTYDLEVALGEQRSARETLAALSADMEHREALLGANRDEVEALAAETDGLEARIRDMNASREKLEGEAAARENSAAALHAEIGGLALGHQEILAQSTALSDGMALCREERAKLQERMVSEERALSEVLRLKQELSGDNQSREAMLEEYRRQTSELEAQLAAQAGELNVQGIMVDEKKAALQAVYDLQRKLEADRTALHRATKDKNEESVNLERECSRMENKLVTGEAEEKSIVDRLWEHYELTPTAAEKLRTPVESLQKANRRIAELKKEISQLGNPNIGAIEIYGELSDRYELLTTQREDAAGAKAELEKIIGGITDEMKVIFAGQFELINLRFGETFSEIFGGGAARLELEDPEDILGCGIEIKAQPPGKKLRSISLLSGGEISLTAIALYFSIFKVRPAPFCMLDELDHELDDANVERFAAYLSRLSRETQFIVITHRRGTMERADELFGVTAQEAGVSKVIPMRLAQITAEYVS